jgi:hypothetical protein
LWERIITVNSRPSPYLQDAPQGGSCGTPGTDAGQGHKEEKHLGVRGPRGCQRCGHSRWHDDTHPSRQGGALCTQGGAGGPISEEEAERVCLNQPLKEFIQTSVAAMTQMAVEATRLCMLRRAIEANRIICHYDSEGEYAELLREARPITQRPIFDTTSFNNIDLKYF